MSGPSTWDQLRSLPLHIEGYQIEGLELETNSGFTRQTSHVSLEGAGCVGRGEEVNWDGELQLKFRERGGYLPLRGQFTLGSFSSKLDQLELSPDPPPIDDWRDFRRWAFESAALDLALRQSKLSLEQALSRKARPLHFGVSLGLHDFGAIEERLAIHADMRFKLDATPDWTEELCAQLAATGAVDVVDFKGAYVGTVVDVEPDLALYQRVLDAMPTVIVEDPHKDPEILALLRERQARVAWDAPIHSVEGLERMPHEASALNIKPSRFGSLQKLFAAYDHCRDQELPMYGGGQFELGVGRDQIQVLASLFHGDGPNDVAPRGYHLLTTEEARPASPMELKLAPNGFGFA